jgi:methyl-accepting chemotaxis protein
MKTSQPAGRSPVIRRFFRASVGFGLLMGIIFPFYALIFARFPSTASLAFFSAGCLGAGLTVGLVSYTIGRNLLLRWIEIRSGGLGSLGEAGAVLDLAKSRELGEISPNFTRFFSALDWELHEIRNVSTAAMEAMKVLVAHFGSQEEILGRLAVRSKKAELALEGMTSQIRTVSERGLSLAEAGAQLRRVLDEKKLLFESLAESGGFMVRTQDSLSALISAERDRNSSVRSTIAKGERAFGDLKSLQQRIADMLGAMMEAVVSMEDAGARSNLLAMNAAIEASHTGHLGRGFAVIAGEMRKQSDESTAQSIRLRGTLASLGADLAGGEAAIGEALEVFDSLLASGPAGEQALNRMDDTARGLVDSGTALQTQMDDFTTTIGRLDQLAASLVAASDDFTTLRGMDGIEEARKTLYELLEAILAITASQKSLGQNIIDLSDSMGSIDRLLSRFKLLDDGNGVPEV